MVEKEPDVLAVKQAAESSPPASEEAELAQSVPLGGPDPPSCPEEQVQALNANAPSVPAEGHGSPGQDAGRPSSSEEQGSPGQDAGRPSSSEEQGSPGQDAGRPLSSKEQGSPGEDVGRPLSSKEQESPGEDVGRPLSSKEQGSPGQDADSYLSLEDGSSILESDCDSDQDLTPSSGPAEPEQLLRRRRNRRHRGLELVGSKEEGRPRRGGPAPGSGSSPQEEGASVSQSGCAMETVLRSLSPEVTGGEELMRELSARVQDVVRSSNWWEIHGIDSMLITVAFLILPAGFLCLRSEKVLVYLLGILILGVAHSTITVKGSHLASHGALTKSKRWGKVWAAFFIEVCSSFPTQVASYNHVNLHHAHTNIIGLGDSSVWKIPALNRFVYLFLAPLALPVLTPLAALGYLKEMALGRAVRALCLISLGLYGHYWLLLKVSGFQTVGSALFYMFLTRTVLSLPFIHINIFQHIGLAMFSPEDRPKRIQQMSHGVLNLPRNLLLDWTFGHSIISCHIEHHLFPCLSDNMCLKIKPIVSQYLMDRKLPYHEDSYLSRLRLFLVRYEELMVHMPPITRLVGIQ